jgi:hypothetical protein
MYTKINLMEDLKNLELYNKIISENLSIIENCIKNKEFDDSFYWTVNEAEIMFINYKDITKTVRVQDIYSSGTIDTQTEELIRRLKKCAIDNNILNEKFEKIKPITDNYTEIAYMIDITLDFCNTLVECSQELRNQITKKVSNLIINQKITIPIEDEDFEYLDVMIDIISYIEDVSISAYLKSLFDKLAEEEASEEPINAVNYLESGYENFEIKAPVKQESDYEDLEDLLKVIKKNNKGF